MRIVHTIVVDYPHLNPDTQGNEDVRANHQAMRDVASGTVDLNESNWTRVEEEENAD